MRQFKVGDKVRFGVDENGDPVWAFNIKLCEHTNYAMGTVGDMDTYGAYFLVFWEDDLGHGCAWSWPQPITDLAHYGEPGYLELIEESKGE